jgi:ParB family chromosome partitioning protein
MILTPLAQMLEQSESIEVALSLMDDFPNHPFRVQADEDMERLIASIQESGVMVPVILRRKKEGRYQIIAGHRRCFACRQLQIEQIPAVIKDISEEEAVIWMVESNVQRTNLLPSEKAKAYQMKMEALIKQGKRTDLTEPMTSRHIVGKWQKETAEKVGIGSGDSGRKVQRYLRLNYLCPELLGKVDEKKIPFLSGVELSYLSEKHQKELSQYLKKHPCSITVKQAKHLRELDARTHLTETTLMQLLEQTRKKEDRKKDPFAEYFPEEYSEEDKRTILIALLKKWKKGEILL